MKNKQKDIAVMKLLKVSEIHHMLAKTNMGELTLSLRSEEDDYFLSLDSVPLDKERNEELMNILYPKKIK